MLKIKRSIIYKYISHKRIIWRDLWYSEEQIQSFTFDLIDELDTFIFYVSEND